MEGGLLDAAIVTLFFLLFVLIFASSVLEMPL